MVLKGEAKRIWQSNYMTQYMREYRKRKPPIPSAIVQPVVEYTDEADFSVRDSWADSHRSDASLYPDCDWDDSILDNLKLGA
jgi:hypothetical protein